jgi:predicted nucleic acid-binding protein
VVIVMLAIRLDDETAARAWSDTPHVARLYDLSAYDAVYLELAIRLGLPLASIDDKLKSTAGAAGVTEFEP